MKRISITLALAAALTVAPASIALADETPTEGTIGPIPTSVNINLHPLTPVSKPWPVKHSAPKVAKHR